MSLCLNNPKGANKIHSSHIDTSNSKTIQAFSLFFELTAKYTDTYESDIDHNRNNNTKIKSCGERFSEAKQLNNHLQTMMIDSLLLQEQKIDCLEQSLSMIMKIHGLSSQNRSSTRVLRESIGQIGKDVWQMQTGIVQKISQIVLNVIISGEFSLEKTLEMSRIILEKLFDIEKNIDDRQKNEGKKGKKGIKKNKRSKITVPIIFNLMNGKKIQLVWFLIFRLLQNHLQSKFKYLNDQAQEIQENELQNTNNEYIETSTNWETLNKKINKFSKALIQKLLIGQFQQYNLAGDFLKTVIQNISQIQLPILPFILKNYHEILISKLSIYHSIVKNSDSSTTQITSKQIYSIQNISSYLSLIQSITSRMIVYESMRETIKANGICSYCGVKKENQMQSAVYQKIVVKINQSQNIILRICIRCCKQLRIDPNNNADIMIFAPLIFSRFWKDWKYGNNLAGIKQSIRKLLTFHCVTVSKKDKIQIWHKEPINIDETIAMNNDEQTISTAFVQSVYKSFLFAHNNLSIKNIIFQTLRLLFYYIMSKDQRIRLKSIKMVKNCGIVQFLFNQNQVVSKQDYEELVKIRQSIISNIIVRVRDSNFQIRIAAIQILSQIFNRKQLNNQRQYFYQDLYNEIAFSPNYSYAVKSIDIIQKTIIQHPCNSLLQLQNISSYARLLLKTFLFGIECISKMEVKHKTELIALRQRVYSMIYKLLLKISQICDQNNTSEVNNRLLEQFNVFFNPNDETCLKVTVISKVYQKILTKMIKQIKIQISMMKNLPYFTKQIIQELVQYSDQIANSQYSSSIIEYNLLNLISILYQKTTNFRNHIIHPKNKKEINSSCRFNVNQISDYINSSHFVQLLLNQNKDNNIASLNTTLDSSIQLKPQQSMSDNWMPNTTKINVLNILFYLNNNSQIIYNQRDLLNYMSIWSKNKNFQTQKLRKIIINSKAQEQLSQLISHVQNNIKKCSIEDIHLNVKFLVDSSVFLNRQQELKILMINYDKYTRCFLKIIENNIESYRSLKQQQYLNKIIFNYQGIVRCITILTALSTNLQKYWMFNIAISSISLTELEQYAKAGRRSMKKDREENIKERTINRSAMFNSCYDLLLNVLDLPTIQNDNISDITRKIMCQLHFFWEVHPTVILISGKLLQSITNNIREQLLIKHLFKMFLQSLPSTKIDILIIINQNFDRAFHSIMQIDSFRNDEEMMKISFEIMYNLLKTGMIGLHHYNKYIYFGLIHRSHEVNLIVTNIITEIYSKQASERVLFSHLLQSLQFMFDYFIENNQQMELSTEHKNNLQILSDITKLKSKVVLVRQRKQVKIKATFIKKLGQQILQQKRLLIQKPLYFMFLMKLIKSQTILDYSELVEIIYTLNKIADIYNLQIERIKQSILQNQNIINETNKINIILAFRQLISCLAYLSGYQMIKDQLKNYSYLLESSPNLYVTLVEQIPISAINQNQTIQNQIQQIQKQIQLYLDIVRGDIQLFQSKKIWQGEEEIIESSLDSNITAKTKLKSRAPKPSKRGKPDASTKFKAFQSFSAQKYQIPHENEQNTQTFPNTRLRNKKKVHYEL